MVTDTIFVCHFVDPDLGIDIFFQKRGRSRTRGVDLEIRAESPAAYCTPLLGNEENFMQSLFAFLLFTSF